MKKHANRFTKVARMLGIITLLGGAGAGVAANNPKSSAPEGFAAGTTGGAGGAVVRVTTAAQLQKELCRTTAGGTCTDNAPRIIEVASTIDFTGTEGKTSRLGCDSGVRCPAPYKQETLALIDSKDAQGYCTGKTKRQISYDAAGDNPLRVGSNKTLIGVGAKGVIKGKGLMLVNGVKNIIIRNLTISDINQGVVFAGDAVTLSDTDHVWIDHNRFQRIGRHMITGGFGKTTNITISWNDFDGNNLYSSSSSCTGHHYWNVLLAGDSQNVTLANNWIHEFHGRGPKIQGKSGMIHLVNNYFQNGTWHALDSYQPLNFLIEGNYFQSVDTPIKSDHGTGYIFGTLKGADAQTQALCKSGLGRNCSGNVAKAARSTGGFAQDSTVMNAFKSVAKSSVVVPYTATDVPTNVKAAVGPGKI